MRRALLNKPASLVMIALALTLPAAAKPKKRPQPPKPVPIEKPAENLPALAPKEEPPPPPPPAAPAQPAPALLPPPPEPAPKPDKAMVDLEALSSEYHSLRDELFRSRAKAEMVGKQLFKTRLVATFQYKAQRAWPLKKVTLRLDDSPVADLEQASFAGQDAPNASDDPIKIFEGFVAPGRHKVSLRVECGATGDANQSYSAESSFIVEAIDGKQSRVKLSVDETGDGPQSLAKKKQGTFDVRVRGDVVMLKLDQK